MSDLDFLIMLPRIKPPRKNGLGTGLKLPITKAELDRLVSHSQSTVYARFINNLRILYTDKVLSQYLSALIKRNRRLHSKAKP